MAERAQNADNQYMTKTHTYAVQLRSRRYSYSLQGWNVKRDGRPTEGNLATFLAAFVESCTTGVNSHLGDPAVIGAYIVDQRTDLRIAEIEVLAA